MVLLLLAIGVGLGLTWRFNRDVPRSRATRGRSRRSSRRPSRRPSHGSTPRRVPVSPAGPRVGEERVEDEERDIVIPEVSRAVRSSRVGKEDEEEMRLVEDGASMAEPARGLRRDDASSGVGGGRQLYDDEQYPGDLPPPERAHTGGHHRSRSGNVTTAGSPRNMRRSSRRTSPREAPRDDIPLADLGSGAGPDAPPSEMGSDELERARRRLDEIRDGPVDGRGGMRRARQERRNGRPRSAHEGHYGSLPPPVRRADDDSIAGSDFGDDRGGNGANVEPVYHEIRPRDPEILSALSSITRSVSLGGGGSDTENASPRTGRNGHGSSGRRRREHGAGSRPPPAFNNSPRNGRNRSGSPRRSRSHPPASYSSSNPDSPRGGRRAGRGDPTAGRGEGPRSVFDVGSSHAEQGRVEDGNSILEESDAGAGEDDRGSILGEDNVSQRGGGGRGGYPADYAGGRGQAPPGFGHGGHGGPPGFERGEGAVPPGFGRGGRGEPLGFGPGGHVGPPGLGRGEGAAPPGFGRGDAGPPTGRGRGGGGTPLFGEGTPFHFGAGPGGDAGRGLGQPAGTWGFTPSVGRGGGSEAGDEGENSRDGRDEESDDDRDRDGDHDGPVRNINIGGAGGRPGGRPGGTAGGRVGSRGGAGHGGRVAGNGARRNENSAGGRVGGSRANHGGGSDGRAGAPNPGGDPGAPGPTQILW